MLKQTITGVLLTIALAVPLQAQYEFTTQHEIACTPVKNQQRTGTCWSFSTISFIEAELLRMGAEEADLSEMYMVRNIYKDKARNYILRQGKANFSQGSLNHDVMRAFRMAGAVPELVYSGLLEGEQVHDHSEMEAALKGLLDGVLSTERPSPKWPAAVDAVMDVYLGAAPQEFEVGGQAYTPQSYAASLPVSPDDYVSFSSFSHHPFYSTFIVEVPDNYSNGSYYNLPLDELQALVDHALSSGYTVAWDGDVSEKGFSAGHGLAILPANERAEGLFDAPQKEVKVTQANRQAAFESFATTDDHLMHLTGIAKDQKGTTYYLTKNSWGEISEYRGFLYMSAPYFRMKTVGLMVHKDAVPKELREKLGW
ncbi:C1 family peptidase [Phaeodactylibacter luteus]|uniref:Aminopeptidase n=1 Tax=Phaeodactylibacter luteus TaxID=1564516 RepID=A0A5C6RM50_9BACT|nr:C1 family peptidase [Phaeodactylibacter luteus]TXB62700.1 aminopeptidase [Phaeodactylibacter luteus]